jgi:hypothetical protein
MYNPTKQPTPRYLPLKSAVCIWNGTGSTSTGTQISSQFGVQQARAEPRACTGQNCPSSCLDLTRTTKFRGRVLARHDPRCQNRLATASLRTCNPPETLIGQGDRFDPALIATSDYILLGLHVGSNTGQMSTARYAVRCTLPACSRFQGCRCFRPGGWYRTYVNSYTPPPPPVHPRLSVLPLPWLCLLAHCPVPSPAAAAAAAA